MTTDVTERIGPRVRTLRESRGLSLRDLASRSGVSAPMLSQVERGETSPTLTVAARIAAGLDLTLSRLLRIEEGDHVRIVRARDLHTVRRGSHAWQDLTPPLDRVSVSAHTLKAKGRTGAEGDPPLHSPGSRETIIVQGGQLALLLDDARYELDEGDSVTFDADLPHRFETVGRAPTRFIAIVTRGLREE